MRGFIIRALKMLPKLDGEQIGNVIVALARENELLEGVLDSLSDGIVVLDGSDCILFMNSAARRLVPFISGDPSEKPLVETIIDRDVARFLRECLTAEPNALREREFTSDGEGESRTLIYTMKHLRVEGSEKLGRVLYIEDATDKRIEESRLRRAESLASLTTLAAGVAHEIKNPLGSMSIHIQLLQRELNNKKVLDNGKDDSNGNTPDDPTSHTPRELNNKKTLDSDENKSSGERIENYLAVLSEEVERLNEIVVDFLFAVRPMSIQLERVYINDKIEEIVGFVRFELERQQIKLHTALAKDLPVLRLDPKYIKQVFLNLIKNSSMAMPDGGTLTISTWQEDMDVVVSVKDDGEGIVEEDLPKIFEPYFTTKQFGSGLGLTMVYKIIKEHNGDLSVKSKPGKGTTFTFKLPISSLDRYLLTHDSPDPAGGAK